MILRLRKDIAFVLLIIMIGLCHINPARADKAAPAPRLTLSQDDRNWLAAHPVIRLGIDTGYAPYSFIDNKGQFQGLVRDYLAYLEPALGVRFEIVSNLDWPQLMAAVKARQIDAVATVTHLPERDAFLEFTALYIFTPTVILTRADTPPLRSLDELAKLNLILVKGYASSKLVMKQFPQLQPRYVAKPFDGLAAVSSGLADAYVSVLGVSTYLAAQHGLSNLKVNAAFDMETNGQRFGVRKDWPQLARILDQALLTMPVQRKDAILQAWLPVHAQEIRRLSQPTLLTRLFPWLMALMGAAILAYLTTALWYRQLKHELVRRQGELAASSERLQAAETIAHVGNWQFKVADASIQWSDEAYRIYGIEPQSQPITYDWLLSRVHPDDRTAHDAYLGRMLESHPGDDIPEFNYRLALASDEVRSVSVRARIEYDALGKPHTLFGTLQDITEQVKSDERIAALNRLYRVLSGINVAIVRLRDPQTLFEEACRVAVEVGGFRMAWLGMLDEGRLAVRPLARAGVVDDYLDNLHISLDEDEHARGPTGTALRAGQHVVCNDIANDPNMAPWCDAALALGYRASAAFPIRVGGQIRGAFNLYADRAGYFNEDELRLLDELAEDIGFALEFIEADHARKTLNRHMVDLLESMSDGFVSLDRAWCYRYVNRKAGEMFGRAPADLIGKHIWTEFPEGEGQPFQQAYQQAMQGGDMIRLEDYYAPWDQWYENRIYPTQDGISVFFTDITARKTREEELKRLHSILNALVEGSTDAIFIKDRDGRYLQANQAIAKLIGQSVEDIPGKDDYAFFPAESADRFRADDLRIMESGTTQSYEEVVNTPDARYSYLTTKGPLIIDGEVRGVFGIARDITDRKLIETALTESESRLRLFIEHAPAALAMFDRDMHYLAVSRRWLTDYQLERSDILGESHYDVFPTIPKRWKAIYQLGMAGELVQNKADRFEREDGGIQWLNWEIRPWFGADSEVGGIVIFSEDITESRQADAELRRQKDLLAHTGHLAHVGGWAIDVATMQGTLTDEMIRIHGLEPGPHITGDQIMACLSSPDRARVEQAQRDAIEQAQPYELELEITTAKGERRWVHAVGLPVLEEGKVVRLEGAVQDITERKQVEAQARRNWLVLDSVFQSLPDLFFLMDANGTIRDYRARQDSALYVPPKTFLGKRMQDVLPPEQGGVFKQKIEAIAKQGGLATYEYDLPMPEGTHHFEARLTQLPGSTQLIAVVRDITRQYKDHLALGESESRYRHLFEHNPAPMLVYERGSLRMLAVNEAFVLHYGYSRDEALALHLTDLYPVEEKQSITDLAASLSGLAYVGEWHHLKKDGNQITIETRSHDIDFENHSARIAVITDITERKQAEAALSEQEAFFRLIAENIGDMVAVLDLEGRRLYNSPSYRTLLGEPTDLKGTDSFAEIHPDDRDTVHEAFMDTVQTGRGHRINFRFVLPDGSARHIESQGGVIRGVDGRVERVVVVSRDVTEHMEMEREIRQLNAELEERVRQRTAELATANKELETFTYSVSHDLKAPLRGIDGYSRLLLEDYQDRLDEAGCHLVNNVRNGVVQMSQLIEDLLTYSRMERRSLLEQTLDLSRLANRVLDALQDEIQAHGMVVDVSLHGLTARADPEGLAIVLRNLLDNALKFTRDSHPPTVSISGIGGEKSITLVVKDNGIGFDMQFHHRIFEIFQRLQRAEDYPGTGVGLAIVHKAMLRMGGRVWAESVPGQGATFYLELPR